MGQNIYSLNSKVARLLLRRTHLSLSLLPSCLFPLLTRTCLLQISTLVEVSLLTPISARKGFSPVLQLFFLLLLQLVKIIKEEKLFFFDNFDKLEQEKEEKLQDWRKTFPRRNWGQKGYFNKGRYLKKTGPGQERKEARWEKREAKMGPPK